LTSIFPVLVYQLIFILQADYIKFMQKFIKLQLDDCNIERNFTTDSNFAHAANRKKLVSSD